MATVRMKKEPWLSKRRREKKIIKEDMEGTEEGQVPSLVLLRPRYPDEEFKVKAKLASISIAVLHLSK